MFTVGLPPKRTYCTREDTRMRGGESGVFGDVLGVSLDPDRAQEADGAERIWERLKAARATHLVDFRLALLEEVGSLADGRLFGGLDLLVGDGFHFRGVALRCL